MYHISSPPLNDFMYLAVSTLSRGCRSARIAWSFGTILRFQRYWFGFSLFGSLNVFLELDMVGILGRYTTKSSVCAVTNFSIFIPAWLDACTIWVLVLQSDSFGSADSTEFRVYGIGTNILFNFLVPLLCQSFFVDVTSQVFLTATN